VRSEAFFGASSGRGGEGTSEVLLYRARRYWRCEILDCATSVQSEKRSLPLSLWKNWGERRGLNPRPSVPQTDALPAELRSPPSGGIVYTKFGGSVRAGRGDWGVRGDLWDWREVEIEERSFVAALLWMTSKGGFLAL
jgi:hypothetical protein